MARFQRPSAHSTPLLRLTQRIHQDAGRPNPAPLSDRQFGTAVTAHLALGCTRRMKPSLLSPQLRGNFVATKSRDPGLHQGSFANEGAPCHPTPDLRLEIPSRILPTTANLTACCALRPSCRGPHAPGLSSQSLLLRRRPGTLRPAVGLSRSAASEPSLSPSCTRNPHNPGVAELREIVVHVRPAVISFWRTFA
jgi:hypothetical protein